MEYIRRYSKRGPHSSSVAVENPDIFDTSSYITEPLEKRTTDLPTDHTKTRSQQAADSLKHALGNSLFQARSSLHKKRSSTFKAVVFVGITMLIFMIIFMTMMGQKDAFAISNNERHVLDTDGTNKLHDDGTPVMEHITGNTLNGFYYWGTLTSTVGFGDICPKSPTAKLITTLYQIFLVGVSLGVFWVFTDGKIKDIVSKVPGPSLANIKRRQQ